MSIAALVHTLLAAGVDHETVVAAVRAVEQQEDDLKRSSAAERQARYRARKASQSVTSDVTDHNVTSQHNEKSSPERPSTSLSEPLSLNQNLTLPPIVPLPASPKKPKREKQQELDDEQILAELSPWLAREAASALIAHRRGLGCKHTAFSVGLLCRELAKCRDPTGQAEKAILSNWKSVYPEKDHAAGIGSGQGSAAAFGSFASRDGRGSGGVVAAAQRVIAGFEREEHLSRQRNGDDREIAGFIVREGIG